MFYKCFIDNEWVEASNGARLEVTNPATGEVWAEVPACTGAEVARALESSQRAQKKWMMLPPVERAAYLYRIAEGIERERDLFEDLLVKEQGKPRAEAAGEVTDTIRYMTYSAEAARRLRGDILPSDNPREQLFIYKVPYGVTLGLCAYNYPLALIGRKVAPALVTGNTMIVKPHEATPVTASVFCRIVQEAGVPPGVINMVTGTGAEVGAPLVESPVVRMITLTGSIRAGQAIARASAQNITALSLELGGSAPFIVLKDADLDKAAAACVTARFANAGQVCICSESVLVEEAVADVFTEKLLEHAAKVKLGDPATNGGMGPITTADALERVERIVAESVEGGAKVALGGKRPEGMGGGHWYEPTVLTGATPDTAAVREEIFGPVLPVVRVADYEEALRVANARPDGLSAYLWTQNPSIYMDAIQRLETGTIFLNSGITGMVQGYHNGHKLSGLGGEDGMHGIEGYLQKRTVYQAY
ncbi:aldehyde dehydrogenase family protein [Antarctobacter heliothermus]|uniref:Lactaldehyde dehydrogenase / glycolaldehyde dehydrogenase n=1 Tax=Antarctobacter heliothermus TaxID=74033 RepID=A0A239FTS0_9RHOB|nr:aldehyde dehydrogenase family protein [Antarctobacter heliothermus]SNS60185.1 lactaldehyde dehydrogenase / glycolaldehyde dehydrogenase [Antarctobacter heliothermus]